MYGNLHSTHTNFNSVWKSYSVAMFVSILCQHLWQLSSFYLLRRAYTSILSITRFTKHLKWWTRYTTLALSSRLLLWKSGQEWLWHLLRKWWVRRYSCVIEWSRGCLSEFLSVYDFMAYSPSSFIETNKLYCRIVDDYLWKNCPYNIGELKFQFKHWDKTIFIN